MALIMDVPSTVCVYLFKGVPQSSGLHNQDSGKGARKKCSEAKKYGNLFCKDFARVSVKNVGHFSQYFLKIFKFFLYNQIFFFFQNQPFQGLKAFLFEKLA